MLDGRVRCVGNAVRPSGDGVLSVVADDRRCLRRRHSSLPGTEGFVVQTQVDRHAELIPDPVYHSEPVKVGM